MEDINRGFMKDLSSEEILIEEAKKGGREAFDKLYQAYKRPILNYLYRYIGNLASAEELTQEVFVRAYLNIHRYEPRAKFSSWLYRIATNLAKNFLRHSHYEKRLLPAKKDSYAGGEGGPDFIENIEYEGRGPHEIAQASETGAIVQGAIDKLPPHLKEALILCDINGLSYDEAAKALRCRPMTVGSRIWRARKALSRLLRHIKNGE